MVTSSTVHTRHVREALLFTALYTLLAAYFSYIAIGSSQVFLLCMPPYLFSAWILIFTAPASGRAAFAIGATAMLAFFGTLITSSGDPKAGQLWWFHIFSVPLAAIGAGSAANYLGRWLQPRSEFATSLAAAIAAGLLPFTFITVFA